MQRFTEYYFEEGILSRGIYNLFHGKKKEGIAVDKLPVVKEIDRALYKGLMSKMANDYTANLEREKKGKKKKSKKLFVKDLFVGEIDDKATKIDKDWDEIKDISIYKTNKGGRIILFSFETGNNKEIYYLGVDNKGGDLFKQVLGMTPTGFLARQKIDREPVSSDTPYTQLLKRISRERPEKSPDVQSRLEPSPTAKKYGFVDIDGTEFDKLVDEWGDGKHDFGMSRGGDYPLRGKIKRERFANDWGGGYKYTIAGEKAKGVPPVDVYLLKNYDNENIGVIAFEGEKAFNKARGLDMLSMWIGKGTEPTREKSIESRKPYWQTIDIEQMPQ